MRGVDGTVPAALRWAGEDLGVFRNHPHAIFVYDLATLRFLEVNDAAVARYGYSRSEFLQMRISDIRADGDPPFLADLDEPGATHWRTGEWHHRRKDGATFAVDLAARQVIFAGRRAALVIAHDASERKRVETALACSEAMVQFSGAAMLRLTPDGIITTLNPAAERMFAYTAAELVGRHISLLVPPDRQHEPPELLNRLKHGETIYDLETVRLRKNGVPVEVSLTTAPIRDAAGKIVGTSTSFIDITERNRVRRKMLEADRASQAKSEFLSRMSHELRTPLNAILGFAQLLELELPGPQHQDSLKHILKAGRHLLDLINEVLDIARIESGRLQVSLEPVSIVDVGREIIALTRPLADEVGVDLQSNLDLIPPRTCALADRQRLKQVLLNLLSNAIKYNRRGGRVRLNCVASPGQPVRIDVQDTGVGISPEVMDRLFVPFERLGAEQTGLEGTGLGLALSKHLVELMGGRLTAASQEGEGSTFSIELRAADDPVAPSSDGPVPEATAQQPARTVLYVDDNSLNAQLVQRVLARLGSIELITVMQGRLAIDLARQRRPDLILLDLNLPDVSGEDVLRRLRQEPATAGIPVIVVSADAIPARIAQMKTFGSQAYLTKPFSVPEMLQTVRRYLEMPVDEPV
jgi:PAS domain S-box-containing protein